VQFTLFAAWKVKDLEPEISICLPGVDDFAALTMRIVLEGGTPEAICLASEEKRTPDDFPFVMYPPRLLCVDSYTVKGSWMESYHSDSFVEKSDPASPP
jgi:hypothetical protein